MQRNRNYFATIRAHGRRLSVLIAASAKSPRARHDPQRALEQCPIEWCKSRALTARVTAWSSSECLKFHEETTAMTDQGMALLARLEQAVGSTEPDLVREALRWAIEELMEGRRDRAARCRAP
jgi:hypothetical protein